MIEIDYCTGRTLCRGRREVRWRGCCGWSQGLPDLWLPVPTVLLTVSSSQAQVPLVALLEEGCIFLAWETLMLPPRL